MKLNWTEKWREGKKNWRNGIIYQCHRFCRYWDDDYESRTFLYREEDMKIDTSSERFQSSSTFFVVHWWRVRREFGSNWSERWHRSRRVVDDSVTFQSSFIRICRWCSLVILRVFDMQKLFRSSEDISMSLMTRRLIFSAFLFESYFSVISRCD